MSTEFDSSRCLDDHCQVCQLVEQLLNNSAEAVLPFDLSEHSCHLFVRPGKDHRCLSALRLDIQGAKYRFISKSRGTRMCDFGVFAVNRNIAQLAAIELKSGAAETEAIEQLEEGVRVFINYFESGELVPEISAYLVVGKQADVLRFALRDKLASFNVNSTSVKFHILDCSESLIL